MGNPEIVYGVRKLLDESIAVKKGEKVLIMTDTAYDREIVEVLWYLCIDREAEVTVTDMLPRVRVGEPPTEPVLSLIHI